VHRIFTRLTGIYGLQKMAGMWGPPEGHAVVHETWQLGLAGVAPESIGGALDHFMRSGSGWPPTLPEFVEACRLAAVARESSKTVLTLPAPGESFTDHETAQENIRKVQDMLRKAFSGKYVK
tara:strand:- start:830 stop:1195 length:366 start_codon:yes stop_codon:yes gene_type:complete